MSLPESSINKILDSPYQVEIWYEDKSGIKTKRTISPIRVFEYGVNTYIEAFCHLRNSNRNFYVNSISSFKFLRNLKKSATSINPESLWFTARKEKNKKQKEEISILDWDSSRSQWYNLGNLSIVILVNIFTILITGILRAGARGKSRRSGRDHYHKTKSVGSCFKYDL